jgi:hypothetical protein
MRFHPLVPFCRTFRLLTAAALLSAHPEAVSASEPIDLADLERVSIADTMVMVPMRDGVRLATDIYRPAGNAEKVPLIFVRTPYDFNEIGGALLQWAYQAVTRGYAIAVQNERGRYYSEGEWELLGHPRTDGYDALTWFAEREWSNGNIGTLGCSSSAEWQLALAAEAHPAHKAMVPMSAGAGIGRVGEFYEQGNWYKGGVHQTLFSIWLYGVQQQVYPRFPAGMSQADLQRLRTLYDLAPELPEVDWQEQVRKLPSIDWLEEAGANAGPMQALMARTPDHRDWYKGGLFHDDEDLAVPAYWFNSWFDVSQGPNLALFNHARRGKVQRARDGQYVLIAPTLHCGYYRIPEHDLIVGELNVGDARFPLYETLFEFFDYYLKDEKNDFHENTPRVQFYTMGRNAWSSAEDWPPRAAEDMIWYLDSDGQANSLFGDGRLVTSLPSVAGSDRFTYDPMNPVPALGGGVCCNKDVALGGSYDQRGIEARADVLVYTSRALAESLEVTGSIHATLYVSSDAKDTDFTVKLVDVHPDGTAYNIDDTILRARYREGYDRQVFMQAGGIYELTPTPMSTSYELQAGHRIRVEVSSSKFPQYMRNLNTGGNNYGETHGVVAHNTIHHSANHPSRITLPVVRKPAARRGATR